MACINLRRETIHLPSIKPKRTYKMVLENNTICTQLLQQIMWKSTDKITNCKPQDKQLKQPYNK